MKGMNQMEMTAIELTDDDYQARMQENSGIVLFYKKICPHCKALKTVIGKVAEKRPDLVVMQIDSEANPAAMAGLEISRAPTLLLISGGQVIRRKTGIMNARELTAFIQST